MTHVQRSTSAALRASRVLATMAFAGTLMAAGGSVASADPVAPAEPSVEVQSTEVSDSAAEAAIAHWTPERMANAKNADTLVEGKDFSGEAVEKGEPQRITGTDADPAVAQKAKKDKGGKDLKAESEQPVDHIGKVFFTLNGSDYVCSGNSVVSENGSTVSTAGHCASEGPGTWATNWVFVPAYENGDAPYGAFAADELFAPNEWAEQGDMTYDTAFARVTGENGEKLSDVVGASGVAFNEDTGLEYTAYGYPAAAPFDGESLKSCTGTAIADPTGGTESQGIPCDMTGGSSGGPWFIGQGADGYQNSVNSFGYTAIPDVMWGPSWGSVIEDSYNLAQGTN